jgi:hypothetical protein
LLALVPQKISGCGLDHVIDADCAQKRKVVTVELHTFADLQLAAETARQVGYVGHVTLRHAHSALLEASTITSRLLRSMIL